MNYIYILIDPKTDKIRYVGKSKNPNKRLIYHLGEAKGKYKNTHKNNWIASLLRENLIPSISIIDESSSLELINFLEKYWIEQFRIWGVILTNGTEGGDGGATMSGRKWKKKSRVKLSNSLKNSKLLKKSMKSKNVRDKISKSVSASLIGNTRAVGSKGWIGKKHKKKSITKMKNNHPFLIPVLMCDPNGKLRKRFPSIHEASDKTGVPRRSISRYCKSGKLGPKNKYLWKLE